MDQNRRTFMFPEGIRTGSAEETPGATGHLILQRAGKMKMRLLSYGIYLRQAREVLAFLRTPHPLLFGPARLQSLSTSFGGRVAAWLLPAADELLQRLEHQIANFLQALHQALHQAPHKTLSGEAPPEPSDDKRQSQPLGNSTGIDI